MMVVLFGNEESTDNKISRSELPFEMGDFCEAYEEAEIQRYYAEHSSSILGTVWKWNLTYYGSSENWMSAALYQSDKRWVLDRIWKIKTKHLEESYKNESAAEVWGALEVWKIEESEYYICYPDQILILFVPQKMGKEEIERLKEILDTKEIRIISDKKELPQESRF